MAVYFADTGIPITGKPKAVGCRGPHPQWRPTLCAARAQATLGGVWSLGAKNTKYREVSVNDNTATETQTLK